MFFQPLDFEIELA